MKFTFTDKKVNIPNRVHTYAEKKIGKLDRYFQTEPEASIVFSVEKGRNNLEVTIRSGATVIRVAESTSDMFVSIDAAVASIERQLRKNKSRLEKRLRKGAFDQPNDAFFVPDVDADEEPSYQLVRTDHGGGNREELALVTSSVDCVLFITPEKLYHATGAYAFGDAEVLNELYVQNLDGSEFRRVYTGNMGDVSLQAVRGGRLYLVESGEADTRRVTSIAEDGSDAQILYEQGSSAWITVSHFEGDEMVLVVREEESWVTRFVAVGLSGSHEQRQLLEVGDDLSMPIWLDGRYSIRSSTSSTEADDNPDAMMMSPDGTITEYAR